MPWILDEWNYYFETPFGVTDPNFGDCSMDRPPNAKPDGRMYLVNHFLDIELFKEIIPGIKVPDMFQSWRTNSVQSIFSQVNLCKSKWGRQPQVVLVSLASISSLKIEHS